MKESCSEGIASHAVPESCGDIGNGVSEALTGGNAGWVLSSEKDGLFSSADGFLTHGRQHGCSRYREAASGSAESETPCMHGHSPHATREIPCSSLQERGARGKSERSTASMNGHGKSDRLIVPKKPANKTEALAAKAPWQSLNGHEGGNAGYIQGRTYSAGATKGKAAEQVEGRGLTKGNSGKRNRYRTQCRERLQHALAGVHTAAKRNNRPSMSFRAAECLTRGRNPVR